VFSRPPDGTFIGAGGLVNRVKVLQCPKCGSPDLYYEAGLITGQKYHCKKCNYVGSLVIERDIPER